MEFGVFGSFSPLTKLVKPLGCKLHPSKVLTSFGMQSFIDNFGDIDVNGKWSKLSGEVISKYCFCLHLHINIDSLTSTQHFGCTKDNPPSDIYVKQIVGDRVIDHGCPLLSSMVRMSGLFPGFPGSNPGNGMRFRSVYWCS